MTTTEIRLKCLELAMSNSYIGKEVNNQIEQAKIYEDYLLGNSEKEIVNDIKFKSTILTNPSYLESEIKELPSERFIDFSFTCDKIYATIEESKKFKNIFNNTKNIIIDQIDVTKFKDLEDLSKYLNQLDKENEIFEKDFYIEHNNQYLVWLNKKMFMIV